MRIYTMLKMVMSHDDSLAGEIIDVRVELEELLVAEKKRDNMLDR